MQLIYSPSFPLKCLFLKSVVELPHPLLCNQSRESILGTSARADLSVGMELGQTNRLIKQDICDHRRHKLKYGNWKMSNMFTTSAF